MKKALAAAGALRIDTDQTLIEFGQWRCRVVGPVRSKNQTIRQRLDAEIRENRLPVIVKFPPGTRTEPDDALVIGYARDLLPLLAASVDWSRGAE